MEQSSFSVYFQIAEKEKIQKNYIFNKTHRFFLVILCICMIFTSQVKNSFNNQSDNLQEDFFLLHIADNPQIQKIYNLNNQLSKKEEAILEKISFDSRYNINTESFRRNITYCIIWSLIKCEKNKTCEEFFNHNSFIDKRSSVENLLKDLKYNLRSIINLLFELFIISRKVINEKIADDVDFFFANFLTDDFLLDWFLQSREEKIIDNKFYYKFLLPCKNLNSLIRFLIETHTFYIKKQLENFLNTNKRLFFVENIFYFIPGKLNQLKYKGFNIFFSSDLRELINREFIQIYSFLNKNLNLEILFSESASSKFILFYDYKLLALEILKQATEKNYFNIYRYFLINDDFIKKICNKLLFPRLESFQNLVNKYRNGKNGKLEDIFKLQKNKFYPQMSKILFNFYFKKRSHQNRELYSYFLHFSYKIGRYLHTEHKKYEVYLQILSTVVVLEYK